MAVLRLRLAGRAGRAGRFFLAFGARSFTIALRRSQTFLFTGEKRSVFVGSAPWDQSKTRGRWQSEAGFGVPCFPTAEIAYFGFTIFCRWCKHPKALGTALPAPWGMFLPSCISISNTSVTFAFFAILRARP